ncbi:uncharacterized protein LOC119600859 isoform X2 [Lucilia sericata]|uniref:uncharacterized protein LOC119600859 isoform X2 n=1 Tax=Lucilia sericata TaxID=13632 RepID=UPI0018A84823|nr:uncharacterized protein LOC119600859 isoform X2 [Lucilia sericata]
MKSKKGAFANSSTGYSKRHNTNTHKSNSNKPVKSSESTGSVSKKNKKLVDKETDKPPVEEQDNDLNSGFGNYLRSNEGVEMMKIFVFANTIMVIVTMAWPHFKAQCYWLWEWLETFAEE